MDKNSPYRFSVAPMMDWTDRHCRYFHRLLSKRARLYTEMLTAAAVIHGPRDRLLAFDPLERPLALQLGGCDPRPLAQAAKIGADYGYDEINLNCGCPSERVQTGAFGACLMKEPVLVGECLAAMTAAVAAPVTVKCRIGVDEQDPREALWTFAEMARAAGASALIVHARKAWLKGLSPRENRDLPPLDYALVHALKRDVGDWPIILNGGLATLEAAREQLQFVDGAMLGRAAYQNPELLLRVDRELFGEAPRFADAFAALAAYESYVAQRCAEGARLHDMTRHLLGLFGGAPGARAFRRRLSGFSGDAAAGVAELRAAVQAVRLGAEQRAA